MELQGEDVETLKHEEPQGIEKNGAENEEEGISEAVARWERRKQERLMQQSTPLSLQDQQQPNNAQIQKQQDDNNNNNTDIAQKYGFIVEGCEFESYGKKAHNTSKWKWRIGRQLDNKEDDEGTRQNNTTTAKLRTKRRKEDDDDDWSGDSDGGKDVRKRPVPPRIKNVQTRSHESKRRKVVSEIEGKTKHSGVVATTSTTSTKKASKSSENEDDDDLDGFLVDDDEEETEVAEEEDEWTDEEEEDEEIEEEEEDPVDGDDRPLCKYGNNCFRKNKDHLTQFRH